MRGDQKGSDSITQHPRKESFRTPASDRPVRASEPTMAWGCLRPVGFR